jgi:hypothetical protein
MIEGFGFLPDVKDAPGTLWAECAVSPMDIASKGEVFLYNLLNNLQEIGG